MVKRTQEGISRRKKWLSEYIRLGLYLHDGNISAAAPWLGMSEKTVRGYIYEFQHLADLVRKLNPRYFKGPNELEDETVRGRIWTVEEIGMLKFKRISEKFWFKALSDEEKEKIRLNYLSLY